MTEYEEQEFRDIAIALDERWFKPAFLKGVLEYEGFTGPAIAARIKDRLTLSIF